jgi:hypothetical protein
VTRHFRHFSIPDTIRKNDRKNDLARSGQIYAESPSHDRRAQSRGVGVGGTIRDRFPDAIHRERIPGSVRRSSGLDAAWNQPREDRLH